jgi:DNA modification methylase
VTAPYYTDDTVTLHLGDSLHILPTLPDASIDAVITDPPYELGFMGKSWDATGIAYNTELWQHCWRVLKPGGHLIAFGAPRTYHRLACAIEDAGFEIRDSLHWIFGSGFPKGQDIAKSIDRRRDDRERVLQVTAWLAAARDAAGWTNRQIDALWCFNGMAGLWTTQGKAAAVPNAEQWARLRELLGFDDTDILPLVAELNGRKGALGEDWSKREIVGSHKRVRRPSDVQIAGLSEGAYDVTAPASEAARRWQGWNTNLKPAHEPIVLARKSTGFNTTVANVLEHGTGALNIDACRTAAGDDYREKCASVVGLASKRNGATLGEWAGTREDSAHPAGRWPTDVLFGHGPDCVDGGACAAACPLPELGEQARFFPVFRYEAKAAASERPRLADGTVHATVKPLALMRWLVRLVTPPNGVVLDPFAGSGATLEAAVTEGFRVIGIELLPEHSELCVQRLSKPIMPVLFGDVA